MDELDRILEKHSKNIDVSKMPEVKVVEEKEEEPQEQVELKNDIIDSSESDRARVFSFLDINPRFTSHKDDKMIETILGYLKGKGDDLIGSAIQLQAVIGGPDGNMRKIEHWYKHIRIQEAMHATKDSHS